MGKKNCCFFGHRYIKVTDVLKTNLYKAIENLILNENVGTFFFGSKSQFNDLCYDVVSDLRNKYKHIKRIYIRAEFPYIDNEYKNYLLSCYEETYFPDKIIKSGKAVYVQRNIEMINKSDFCIIYLDSNYAIQKSGTRLAYEYATQKQKTIINVLHQQSYHSAGTEK